MPEKCAQMDSRLRKIDDYEAFDARVKEHDKDCFRLWRDEQLASGTYRAHMAEIFSGGENVKPDQIRPWTDQEEEAVLAWLEQDVD
jgi:hypothetical protein